MNLRSRHLIRYRIGILHRSTRRWLYHTWRRRNRRCRLCKLRHHGCDRIELHHGLLAFTVAKVNRLLHDIHPPLADNSAIARVDWKINSKESRGYRGAIRQR